MSSAFTHTHHHITTAMAAEGLASTIASFGVVNAGPVSAEFNEVLRVYNQRLDQFRESQAATTSDIEKLQEQVLSGDERVKDRLNELIRAHNKHVEQFKEFETATTTALKRLEVQQVTTEKRIQRLEDVLTTCRKVLKTLKLPLDELDEEEPEA